MFCLAAPETAPNLRDMISEATGSAPTLLEIKNMLTPGNAAPGDQNTLFTYTAAIGAALRNL